MKVYRMLNDLIQTLEGSGGYACTARELKDKLTPAFEIGDTVTIMDYEDDECTWKIDDYFFSFRDNVMYYWNSDWPHGYPADELKLIEKKVAL